jgi:peroxiredoxin
MGTFSRLAFALACVFAVGCGGASANSPESSTTAAGTNVGSSVTDFTLRDVDGKTVHLSDYNGKGVLMVFWATWCVPCHAQLPLLDKIYNQYKDSGFVVLAVSMDGPESVASVAPDIRRLALSYPVLLDEETKVTSIYNPKRTAPLSLLINQKGQITQVRQGFNAGDEKLIEADVKALFASATP